MRGVEAPDVEKTFVVMDDDDDRVGKVDEVGLPLVYDRALIQAYWDKQGGALQERWSEFVRLSVPWLTRVVAMGIAGGADELQRNGASLAKDARVIIEKLGPTYIKAGQMMSVRPDVLPDEALAELAVLQDSVKPFETQVAIASIERELGAPLGTAFSEISEQPVAAASLAQVYKATLLTGETVAVKVQRPGIRDGILLDLFLIRSGAKLVDGLVDSLNTSLVSLVDEFASRVVGELDYVQEGRNAERFCRLYGDRPDVVVPAVRWDLTGATVLTTQWVEGTKLSEQESLRSQGLDVLALVDIGIQCSLRQLLEHGYFHADPHPGNLLATPDGRLAFLDFGMMSETPPGARYAIIGHVVHLVNRDYDAMARDYYALDFLDESVDVSPIAPALEEFFGDVLGAAVAELNFKRIVDGLGAVLYQYPFNVPAYYALILRSLTVLEGLALLSDPQFKVLAAAYPYFARRLLTDRAPELREALVELLFKDGEFRWNRLENLLREGSQSADYSAGDVAGPMLDIVLGEGGGAPNPLKPLVEAEAVKVAEALLLGPALEGARSEQARQLLDALPESMRGLRGAGLGLVASEEEEREIAELRGRVLEVWELLSTSRGFEEAQPRDLGPVVEALQEPRVAAFLNSVSAGLVQRVAARGVRSLLRAPAL
mmetsp:Transcript_2170/g.7574  ORF Transcript_2170/g.7574 Transcript_2170/m.7574 type:complete len:659 (+) Transcript_2170:757-2733(+)